MTTRILILFVACATIVYGQQPAPPAANEDNGAAQARANLAEVRTKGDLAFAAGLFEQAQHFYQEYWMEAYNQDLLIDATERLVKTLIRRNKINDAMTVLNGVTSRVPDFAAATEPQALTSRNRDTVKFWRARVLLLTGKHEKALPLFEQIARNVRQDRLPDLYIGIAECQVRIAEVKTQSNDPESELHWLAAERALLRVVEEAVDPSDKRNARFALVRVYLRQGQYDAADTIIFQEFPDAEGKHRNKLGMYKIAILLARDEVDKAYQFYRTSMIASPTYAVDDEDYPLLRRFGHALWKAGNPAVAAREIYEKNIVLYTAPEKRQQLLLDAAEAWAEARVFDVAIARFRDFISTFPEDAREVHVYYRMGQIYEIIKDPQAIATFKLVYDWKDAEPELRYQAAERIARLYQLAKRFDEVIKAYLAAASLPVAPLRQAQAEFYAAQTSYQMQQYNEAALYYGNVADSFVRFSTSEDADHKVIAADADFIALAEEARFKQAQAHYEQKQYKVAAVFFAMFLQEWPDSKRATQALLQLGLSHNEARNPFGTVNALKKFADTYPADGKTPYALLVAAQAYQEMPSPRPQMAISQLSRIVDDKEFGYAFSKEYPFALYWRCYLYLANGEPEKAHVDGRLFVVNYGKSHPVLAAEVCLWLGYQAASVDNYDTAENYFNRIITEFPKSPSAPRALYRAAENSYKLKRFSKAVEYLDRMPEYPDAPDRIKAKAWFLRGDIASADGKFEEATRHFGECAKLEVDRTPLYYASVGRQGDCYYSLGGLQSESGHESYKKALEQYAKIIDLSTLPAGQEKETLSRSFTEMATYRSAKIHEILANDTVADGDVNHLELAQQLYLDIFFDYNLVEISTIHMVEWYYFSRAGFDLAKLYVKGNRTPEAITVYERIGRSEIPTAPDARQRAAELKLIKLTDVDRDQP